MVLIVTNSSYVPGPTTIMSSAWAALTADPIVLHVVALIVQVALELDLLTCHTVTAGTPAFALAASRTNTAPIAAESTKRLRLFNMICSRIIEPPLSVQWEIGFLGLRFLHR
jgi:hypothetical protein